MSLSEVTMNKKLRRIEIKLLLYFNMVADGCRNYIKNCEYTPYFCGYSEPRQEPVNTYELCLFATGAIKCQGEIEKHYRDKHSKSSYRTVLRAIESLEKKGYIVRNNVTEHLEDTNSKWFMAYKLSERPFRIWGS